MSALRQVISVKVQTMHEEKSRLRSLLKERRRSLPKEEREKKAGEVLQRLKNHPYFREAKKILIYLPFGTELPLHLTQADLLPGQKLFAPYCLEDGSMEAYELTEDSVFDKSPLGFLYPRPESSRLIEPEKLDLILLPLLGFTRRGDRIGYGRAFYDRYMRRTGAKRLGIAFALQEEATLPSEEHDLLLDSVITEKDTFFSHESEDL